MGAEWYRCQCFNLGLCCGIRSRAVRELELSRDSAVGAVQAIEDWPGFDSSGRVIGQLRLRDRAFAVDALMWPGDVVVVVDELSQQGVEMSLAEDDHVIEQFASQRSTESLDERVLPRAVE